MVTAPEGSDGADHVLLELRLGIERRADELHGSAPIVAEMHVPGHDVVRTSVLATWVDTIAGLLVADVVQPRVPVTVELDVRVAAPVRGVE